jgi:hypothetical protein
VYTWTHVTVNAVAASQREKCIKGKEGPNCVGQGAKRRNRRRRGRNLLTRLRGGGGGGDGERRSGEVLGGAEGKFIPSEIGPTRCRATPALTEEEEEFTQNRARRRKRRRRSLFRIVHARGRDS